MEARKVDAVEPRNGELWLTDEGKHLELDLVGDLNWPVPVRLDEEGAQELRRALDLWLEQHEPPQQEMELLPGQPVYPASHPTKAGEPVPPKPPADPLRGRSMDQVLDDARRVEQQLSDVDEKQLGPFAPESETSRKAALEAYPRQGSQRWQILGLFRDQWAVGKRREGWTRDELADKLGLSPNTIRPRVVELLAGGWLTESDATRPSTAGHDSAVLVLTAKAIEREERETL